MIYCLVTAKHAYTWKNFLSSWGKSLAARISILAYEDVVREKRKWDAKGVHIFCDLDRLTPKSRVLLATLHRALCYLCGSRHVLNHPSRSMQRYDLLRVLHAIGLNRFGVQSLTPREAPDRFPVLIRPESGRPQMDLSVVRNENGYRVVIKNLLEAKVPLNNLLAVELCDTADKEGIYRKYGAFIVGETIVPRHVFFSKNWRVKDAELADPRFLEEENAYMEANPHAEALGRIARIADISYGRIDYSMLDGDIQTWEINTNPMIASVKEIIPARHNAHLKFLALFARALETLERN